MLAISRRRSSTNGAPPQAPIPGKYHAAVGRFPGTEACGYALRLWESCISLRRIFGSLREGTSEARCWPYSLSLRALTARLSGDTRSAAATKAPGAPPRDPPQRRWERSAAARARHFPSSPRGTGSPPKPCPALPCPTRRTAPSFPAGRPAAPRHRSSPERHPHPTCPGPPPPHYRGNRAALPPLAPPQGRRRAGAMAQPLRGALPSRLFSDAPSPQAVRADSGGHNAPAARPSLPPGPGGAAGADPAPWLLQRPLRADPAAPPRPPRPALRSAESGLGLPPRSGRKVRPRRTEGAGRARGEPRTAVPLKADR